MRKLTFIYLFLLSFVSFSQKLGNPAVIGQSSRNQKVGKGFQIEDTLLAKGKVRFSVVSVGSTKDTFVTLVDTAGYVSKVAKSTFLSGVGDVTQSTLDDTASALNTRIAAKQNTITTGTTAQYFRGDLSLATFPTNNTSFTNGAGYTTASSTTTFTNKRITARVDSTSSSATPSINTDNVDTYKLTAQAADITSFTTNLSGTPTDDQILHIVIIGTATRAITWGSKFESSTVTLPTTTVGTAKLDVYFIWNTATSKWRCGGVW